MIYYITLCFCVVATAMGQLLIKKGIMISGSVPSGKNELITYFLKLIFLNPYIFGGLVLAVLQTVSWMYTMSKFSLSFAFPFYSLAYPLVLVLTIFFFNEHISFIRWIGIAIIMVGIYFVSRG